MEVLKFYTRRNDIHVTCIFKSIRNMPSRRTIYPLSIVNNGTVENPTTRRRMNATSRRSHDIFGLCIGELGDDFKPLDYQQDVADYMAESPHPGIMLMWELGTGKTKGAALIADTILDNGPQDYIWVFSAASLRKNFIQQYLEMGAKNRHRIGFVTTNASDSATRIPSIQDLANSVIIIDEYSAEIGNGMRNKSINATSIYNTLLKVPNARFILLTGTPITKDEKDIFYIAQLIAPTMFPSMEQFLLEYETPNRLKEKLQEIISRVDTKNTTPDDYPTVTRRIIPIPIQGKQLEAYEKAKDKEHVYPPNKRLKVSNPDAYKQAKTRYYLAYSMLVSRQMTNMYYPSTGINDRYVTSLRINAPKIGYIINQIVRIPGKHAIFSQFKTRYGINDVAHILDLRNITYLKFTGNLDDEGRADVVTKWNSRDNINGENYRVILMTEAAALGQNFMHVQKMFIMEGNIDEIMLMQVEGRVNRYRSHIDLPLSKRHITIERLMATTERIHDIKDMDMVGTSDWNAYSIGKERIKRITPMLTILKELKVL